jgi:hypothetical protein
MNCIHCGDTHQRLDTNAMCWTACSHCPPRKKKEQREEVKENRFNGRRVRHGKTAKDHRSGAWRQRLENRSTRAMIIRETKWDRPLPAVL